jgi:hypothetical protein
VTSMDDALQASRLVLFKVWTFWEGHKILKKSSA